jgi:hypothetical protein
MQQTAYIEYYEQILLITFISRKQFIIFHSIILIFGL